MISRSLIGLFGAVSVVAMGSVACASDPPVIDVPNGDAKPDGGGDTVPSVPLSGTLPAPSAPPPAPTTPPPAPPVDPDAGAPAPDPTPAPTTFCVQLTQCCGTLTDTVEKLACIGATMANDEKVCEAALVVCLAGFGNDPNK